MTGPSEQLRASRSYLGQQHGIEVFWNRLSLTTITGNGNNRFGWLDHVYNVENDLGILKFAAIGISDSDGSSLDNISVTAIPEPETFAMLLTGLGLLAGVTRRRISRIDDCRGQFAKLVTFFRAGSRQGEDRLCRVRIHSLP
jgi:hypothetical protein